MKVLMRTMWDQVTLNNQYFLLNELEGYNYLSNVSTEINVAKQEGLQLMGKCFDVIYHDVRNKAHLFFGKILKLFPEDGNAKKLVVECFKRAFE